MFMHKVYCAQVYSQVYIHKSIQCYATSKCINRCKVCSQFLCHFTLLRLNVHICGYAF